ncbi:MAG: hypothetical protein V3V20_08010 [Algisphaera sp.]
MNAIASGNYLPLIPHAEPCGAVKCGNPLRAYQQKLVLNQPMMWEVVNKLKSFAELVHGWDGDQAPAICPNVIAAVRDLIVNYADLIASPFFVVLTLEGGVQLEWRRGSRELELELINPFQIEYLFTDEDKGVSEENTFALNDESLIRELITRVNGG